MQKISIFAIIIYFFSLVCLAATPDRYTQDKPGIMVTADKAQFEIQLTGNPTTGFLWFLKDYDPHFLQPIKHQFVAAKTNLIGAPGVDIWTFKVNPSAFVVPQLTMIRFIYSRPWEGITEKEHEVTFTVSTMPAH